MDIEEETRQELVALQREKELLQAKERENEDAIDEVGRACRSTDCCAGKRGVVQVQTLLREPFAPALCGCTSIHLDRYRE